MYVNSALLSVATAMLCIVIATGAEGEKPKKLQIGVRKRVSPEECTIKSRKGDSLSMHYTVSASSSDIFH